jgi:hypothetical protein
MSRHKQDGSLPSPRAESAKKTPRERFVIVAQARVNKVLHALDALGKCSTKAYDYQPREVLQIFAALNRKIEDTHGLFQRGDGGKQQFILDGGDADIS